MLSFFRRMTARFRAASHLQRLEKITPRADGDYRQYLDAQVMRAFDRHKIIVGVHTRILVDKLVELRGNLNGKSVLCVGCRNELELDYFQSTGAASVTGVDLFSHNDRITVMDMHDLKFDDGSFDVVYSAHSLEHAYDAERVAAQFVRVAKPDAVIVIEVPIDFEPTAADRVDFKNVGGLAQLFAPYDFSVCWSQQQPPWTDENQQGTSIVRAILSR